MTLSFNSKRIGAGILLLIVLFCQANYHLGWGIFAGFDRQVMIASLFVGILYLVGIGPTLEELKEHRDRRNREKHTSPTRFRGWLYILTLSLAMLFVALIWPVLLSAKGKAIEPEDWIALIVLEAVVLVVGIRGWYILKRLYDGTAEP